MIRYQKLPYIDDQIYAKMHPFVEEWWTSKFKEFSAPQKYGIIPIHNRENTLIFASTGSGKTLTAFASIINELTFLAELGTLEDRVYCVYISPLKALSRDINVNLKEPLSGIKKIAKQNNTKVDIKVAVRTGDTTASKKAGMLKNPPHILITTPESFAIVLSSKKFREKLAKVEWVIVDEIHALASSKRGVHLSLSIERLAAVAKFSRIGLSATVAPLEEVAKYLVGKNEEGVDKDCTIVDAQFEKKMDLKVLCPVPNLIDSPHDITYNKMYELINSLVQQHMTTLIFTNTRSATERVVHTLKDKFPKTYTEKVGEAASKSLIGAHHGSLSTTHRLMIEDQLKAGQLKCIVSSTSLELGIDIGYIDLVILLGSPKSVARAMQRIGRSGHQLHETAKGRIIVLDRDDLVECAVLLKAAIEKKIDKIDIPKNCLDVLAQQVFGMAVERMHSIEEAYDIVKRSYCYSELKRRDFDEVLNYLAGEYVSLEERHVYAKIWVDKETMTFGARSRMGRVLYMTNIGTIPDESYITVKVGDEVVGKLDESFLERLKRGDVFVLGGDTYEFQFARGMVATVKTSSGRPPTVPSWFSEMLPLSFDLAIEIQKLRQNIEQQLTYKKTKAEIIDFLKRYLYVDEYGADSIYGYLYEQYKFSQIGGERTLVVEHFKEDERKFVVFNSLYGRRVNDVLSRALAFAIAKTEHRDVEITINDNGFMLSYTKNLQVIKAFNLISAGSLDKVMEQALDKTEILQRRFRHCASRALMILRSYRGHRKTVGKQQVSSMLLLNAVKQISNDFIILKEARREILEDLMDINNAAKVLKLIKEKKIVIHEKFVDYPSPFSFNLILQGYSDIFKIEDRADFLKRMHEKVLAQINGEPKKEEIAKFSYHAIWDEMQEKRRIKKIEEIDELKTIAANITDVSLIVKEALYDMIDNKSNFRKDALDIIKEKKEDFPDTLKVFVAKKLHELDEKTILLKQLNKASYKEHLENDITAAIKRLIDGERSGFSGAFISWLTNFLEGTIPFVWEKEIVNFLKKAKDEIEY